MNSEQPKIVEFSQYDGGEKGILSVLEEHEEIFPFPIKRIYWTYGAEEGTVKGDQSNKRNHQLVVAVSGETKIIVEPVQGEPITFTLSSPNQGLYIPPLYWRKVIPSKEAIILSISSEKYDQEEYITNYNEFKQGKF